MSLTAHSFEAGCTAEPITTRFTSHPSGFAASLKSSSRAHYRPPPILLVEGEATSLSGSLNRFKVTASPNPCSTWTTRSKSPVEPIDSPAFMKGDLNFNTFRSRAALAIAEWGPSPTGTQFCLSAPPSPYRSNRPSPENTESSHLLGGPTADRTSSSPSNASLHPGFIRHSQSYTSFSSPPSTPFSPLTPGPYNVPQHRVASQNQPRPTLKARKIRPRPCPLQPSPQTPAQICDPVNETNGLRKHLGVRFADGSPQIGSTWHLTQYPERLASPPISAANLSLADLVELESIKQSLGTWCGEMMGSPMRVTFSQSSSCSGRDSRDL
ncbi:hypothetical protein CROQUDRAFT_182685 [Cronartium quercuum f. sp. fusiforme G11]|uniref:Uncharacterized protein n=1 Tax=Cronartium quercuum f. sp. fusiforme G11 TaxID=708437 RepID=A0A9P6NG96_9BASI|nr:hypothetical protein CROQUDRAFT_182685 [Cronartium quercuum f. sp. fusiforme G11]